MGKRKQASKAKKSTKPQAATISSSKISKRKRPKPVTSTLKKINEKTRTNLDRVDQQMKQLQNEVHLVAPVPKKKPTPAKKPTIKHSKVTPDDDATIAQLNAMDVK